jgi:DNA polymerase III subunit alpha
LKTLSIIKETLENIKLSKGIVIDIDTIPENDPHTLELLAVAKQPPSSSLNRPV